MEPEDQDQVADVEPDEDEGGQRRMHTRYPVVRDIRGNVVPLVGKPGRSSANYDRLLNLQVEKWQAAAHFLHLSISVYCSENIPS